MWLAAAEEQSRAGAMIMFVIRNAPRIHHIYTTNFDFDFARIIYPSGAWLIGFSSQPNELDSTLWRDPSIFVVVAPAFSSRFMPCVVVLPLPGTPSCPPALANLPPLMDGWMVSEPHLDPSWLFSWKRWNRQCHLVCHCCILILEHDIVTMCV